MNKGHLESFHVPRTRCNNLKANLLKTGLQKPSARSFWSPFCRIPLSTNMNLPSMTKNVPLATLCLLFWGLGGAPSSAQTSVQVDSTAEESGWWKGLFRQTVPDAKSLGCAPQDTLFTAAATDSLPTSSVAADSLQTFDGQGSVTWLMDGQVAHLDSLAKDNPKAMQGYRIQIYFGSLSEARAVKAAFRKEHPDVGCQLLPISPNYAVTVGNFRDQWEARRALGSGDLGTWRNALVIPSEIDFALN